MCGITGYYQLKQGSPLNQEFLSRSIHQLKKRGPNHQGQVILPKSGLGHARLSILDTSEGGHQPMLDDQGRYVLIYNGEIYNFHQLRNQLSEFNISWKSSSDTEVLLHLLIHYGADALQWLQGFFAFAFYDQQEDRLFIARDRFGIKPLVYTIHDHRLYFSSELKALLSYPVPRQLDPSALLTYLQLNYTPAPKTMLKGIYKLMPGHYMEAVQGEWKKPQPYYQLESKIQPVAHSFEEAAQHTFTLLEEAVEKRMIADVPLGAFLSGGIDSSAIVALASKKTKHLNTFSIGFRDQPFFDETRFAEMVANHYQTNHTSFSLTHADLYQHLFDILDYFDEPFADSSAIAVYILSLQTARKVTVALSGDGADELFGGYNKHRAEWRARRLSSWYHLLTYTLPIFRALPASRQSASGNLIRQIIRFSEGIQLSPAERYWRWCSLAGFQEASSWLQPTLLIPEVLESFQHLKSQWTAPIHGNQNMNDVFLADFNLVLPNDMLTKVDLMSMANSLEVRVPFLDHALVEYVSGLPAHYKLNQKKGKLLLRHLFEPMLPAEIFNRPKHGFEVPLLSWMRNELKDFIRKEILDPEWIESQQIFRPEAMKTLQKQLYSTQPGDIQGRMWGIIVFQYWYKKYLS